MAAFFGFHMPNFTFPGVPNDRLFDRVVHNAQAAETAGFDLVTVMDHFYQIRGIGPETEPMMEAYSTLSALATQTSRVKLTSSPRAAPSWASAPHGTRTNTSDMALNFRRSDSVWTGSMKR